MLNSALVGLMSQNRSLLFATSSAQQAATRGLYYENARFRNKRYRSASRQMAKEKKRQRMAGQKSVQESGEEIP